MLSLSKLRIDLFTVFRTMRDQHLTIEFYHRRKIYSMTVRETGRRIQTPYRLRDWPKHTPLKSLINSEECEKCHALRVNGICMTPGCGSQVEIPPVVQPEHQDYPLG